MRELHRPWLVAAWPGMGAVGQIAGSYLLAHLHGEPVAQLEGEGFFEASSVRIRAGLVQLGRSPRSVFHAVPDPGEGRDLLVMVGEQQPTSAPMHYARALLDAVRDRKVERVVTFAAMATAMLPPDESHVFAACTTEGLREELRCEADGLVILGDAEIGGMNGLLLLAAQERGIPAMSLLGELPFFAAGVANPKAAAAVLRALARLARIEIDLGQLEREGLRTEQWLQQQVEGRPRAAPAPQQQGRPTASESGRGARAGTKESPRVPPEVLQRIEMLFAACSQDRSKALELKAELDRHGLFRDYEDRFLDLFKSS